MAIPIIIPRLGWNMEQGTFLGWLKPDGAQVRAGESLFRLESEKATEDIECLDSGVLRIAPKGPKEGDTLPVGIVIGYLAQPEEKDLPIADFRMQVENPQVANTLAAPFAQSAIRDPQSAIGTSTIASPRARRVAAELGVDWTRLTGGGRNGRIREGDVRAAAQTADVQTGGKIVPLSALRKTSAARLVKSVQATVPVTLTTTADVTNLVKLRSQLKSAAPAGEPIPGMTDFFVKLTAQALRLHPLLAARWAEDHLVLPEEIHIGIAVDTGAGLLVPVIHHADALSLQQLACRSRDLVERARQGKLATKDLQGGVFTVTNLGQYGIDAFTPVINHPECAILGIGRIRRVPVFVGETVVARDQVTLSLTFDHRIVDGVPAAKFLQALTQGIEHSQL